MNFTKLSKTFSRLCGIHRCFIANFNGTNDFRDTIIKKHFFSEVVKNFCINAEKRVLNRNTTFPIFSFIKKGFVWFFNF